MWQRDPGSISNGSRGTKGVSKNFLQREREKKERTRFKANLRRRVNFVLQHLQQEKGEEIRKEKIESGNRKRKKI